jgi:flagellar hook protein FlgE
MYQIGLSGLKSTQAALEVTSNNIANSSTSGFKSGSTEFAAVYNGGQRGGVTVSDIRDDFGTSGNLVTTGSSLDLAITGKGFFTISVNGGLAYTQAGNFKLDNDLNIVNANGAKLQGYGVDEATDPNIVSGILTDLKIEGRNMGARATDDITFSGNLSSASDVIPYPAAPSLFDPTDGSAYNYSQSSEVMDSLGNSHNLTQYYNHTGGNVWDVMYFVDGQPLTAADLGLPGAATAGTQGVDVNGTPLTAGVVTMTFDVNGQLVPLDGTSPAGDNNTSDPFNLRKVELSFTSTGAAQSIITLDLTKSTQYGSGFAMYENDPNGYTAGEYSGVSVDDDGKIYATFTNGESKLQGQLVLASFANVDGLQQGNNTVYYNTTESGAPLYGAPGTGVVGDLLSGSFMSSNVNISEQLVDLMSFQQNYQANAKTISSADEMMQILFNAV